MDSISPGALSINDSGFETTNSDGKATFQVSVVNALGNTISDKISFTISKAVTVITETVTMTIDSDTTTTTSDINTSTIESDTTKSTLTDTSSTTTTVSDTSIKTTDTDRIQL